MKLAELEEDNMADISSWSLHPHGGVYVEQHGEQCHYSQFQKLETKLNSFWSS